MDLLQLRQMGLVTSNPLIKKTITIKYHELKPEDTWESPTVPEREEAETDGEVTFWLRKFTAADRITLNGTKSFEDRAYLAIQRSVYTEDGTPVFPEVEDAEGLDLVMFGSLLVAINELNDYSEKKSQPRTNGGAKSRSPSAVGRSKNGRKPSAKTSGTSGSSIDTSSAH